MHSHRDKVAQGTHCMGTEGGGTARHIALACATPSHRVFGGGGSKQSLQPYGLA